MTPEQKPLPCGWCRKEPAHNSHIAYCRTDGCPGFAIVQEVSCAWNPRQIKILDGRRKDFEAGLQAQFLSSTPEQMFDDYIKGEK